MDYPIQNQSKRRPTAQTLSYAQSLRAIGQALEAFRLKAFELHKNGPGIFSHVGVSESAGKLRAITAKLSGYVGHFKIPITSSAIDRLDVEDVANAAALRMGPLPISLCLCASSVTF